MKKYYGNYPKKWVECDECGYVNQQPKAYPLRYSCCKTCGSMHIRLYRPPKDPQAKNSKGE
jgi:hypothetical protein